jgi:N-acetylglucosaminyl-diphospho-decaprenol L-rhamnosyltransferase
MTVVVVNYNTRTHLQACLDTLPPHAQYSVIVVDNGSTDGSIEMVCADYPHITLMVLPENKGYGGAANQALLTANTPYALLLNSDTLLHPKTIPALIDYMDAHPRVAIVGPRLLNANGTLQPSCYPFPTPWFTFLEESALWQIPRWLPFLKERSWRTWSHNRAQPVPWVLGAVLAIRCDALQQVKGFDPAFFMYFEEVDLCYRLTLAGWQIHFAPVTEVVHIGGVSTSAYRLPMFRALYQSMVRYYRTHYPPQQLHLLRPVMMLILGLRFVRDFILRNPQNMDTWKQVIIALYQNDNP